MVWLRIDIDNPCYYHPIWIRIRLRYPLPIPGYYLPTRETLAYLRAEHPNLPRRWFIRSTILPPRELLNDEDIGLHVTNPRNVISEYAKVSRRFGREIEYYTSHGKAQIASGRLWTAEDERYVKSKFPNMVNLSNLPHYTITRLPVSPDKLNVEGIDHVLFHDVHFRVAQKELEAVLDRIDPRT
jgi:hypothetical protein